MKKTTILSSLLALALLTACSSDPAPTTTTPDTPPTTSVTPAPTPDPVDVPEADPVDVTVLGMSGPTAMGMVHMMNEVDSGNLTSNNYDFSIVTAIDEVTPQIVSGGAGIAAVPANVASVLYNNTEGGIQVLAINTLGVLYIVESGDTVTSIQDLEGKTIFAAGKGGTPEYAINYILEANGLTDSVTIEWKTEQAEVVAALAATEGAIGMLPQPFATTAQMSNESIRVALDLTEEWNATDSEGMLVTGVVVANSAFAAENPDAIADFLKNYETSVNFVNDNLEEGAALVGQYGIVPEAVALAALPYCSITYIDGAEMETALTGYLAELFAQNPASIGGAMPEADFFYGN
ncbi:MAG: ABC transporter substrate-binding protein [Eubacteriales bacterium]